LKESLKRQKVLLQALDPATSDKQAAQLLEQLAMQYPKAVADDPVYVTALRNMHIDVVSVLAKHSHVILDGNVGRASTNLGIGAGKPLQEKVGTGTARKGGNAGTKRGRDITGSSTLRKRKSTKKPPAAATGGGGCGGGSGTIPSTTGRLEVKKAVPAPKIVSSEAPTVPTTNQTASVAVKAMTVTKSEPAKDAAITAPPKVADGKASTGAPPEESKNPSVSCGQNDSML
jgi:hypothetical protein